MTLNEQKQFPHLSLKYIVSGAESQTEEMIFLIPEVLQKTKNKKNMLERDG